LLGLESLDSEQALSEINVTRNKQVDWGHDLLRRAVKAAGVALCRTKEPDRFTLDPTHQFPGLNSMPGKTDGLDLARQVRAADSLTKIVIMSGRPTADLRSYCDLFIAEPFVDAGDRFLGLMANAA
jgi:hypothetical protein